MTDQPSTEWPFKVEISVAGDDVNSRYAAIETWLSEWQMPHRLVGWIAASGKIRASFVTERHARAFQLHFGGRVICGEELNAVLVEDAEANKQFQNAVSKLQGLREGPRSTAQIAERENTHDHAPGWKE